MTGGRLLFAFSLCFAFARSTLAQVPQPISSEMAQKDFAEAEVLCKADAGKLWGVSLCGPMMFVDPGTRSIVANQPDAKGVLTLQNGVYVGLLPKSQNIANTAMEWSGTRWTQMILPLPAVQSARYTLMMHELFHRIQNQLKIPSEREGDNAQLDTPDGRYFLQLEYRALARAIKADTENERKPAIVDALIFRAERYKLFPNAAAEEKALELNEGLAEYTGVRLGNPMSSDAMAATLDDLSRQTKVSTFVRSFAYATGPSYGLLLDRYAPDWRTRLSAGEGLSEMLGEAVKITLPTDLQQTAEQRALQYDGAALRAAETEREVKRKAMLALYRAKFVDGAILTLPLKKMNVQFDPRTLQPFGDLGTVYPTIRITDVWGVLQVSNGALLKPDWSAVVVVAPSDATDSSIKGDGWTLEIKPGWKLTPAARSGDYSLQPAS
jgi:hypothetical protein